MAQGFKNRADRFLSDRLLGYDSAPHRHQITELPLVKATVTEHQVVVADWTIRSDTCSFESACITPVYMILIGRNNPPRHAAGRLEHPVGYFFVSECTYTARLHHVMPRH